LILLSVSKSFVYKLPTSKVAAMKKTINKRLVETLPFASSGTDYFLDAKLAGFGLRVGKTKKVFIVEKRVRGKTVRVKIGEFPLVTVEDARKRAQEVLAQMSEGIEWLFYNWHSEFLEKRGK